jgi:hypothetical protein
MSKVSDELKVPAALFRQELLNFLSTFPNETVELENSILEEVEANAEYLDSLLEDYLREPYRN